MARAPLTIIGSDSVATTLTRIAAYVNAGLVAPVSDPTSFSKLGPIGGNLDTDATAYYGECITLDHSRAAGIWHHSVQGDTLVVEGIDGYPVSSTGGDTAFALVPFDNPAVIPGVSTRYAWVTSWTTCAPSVEGALNATTTTQTDGRLRYEFDIDPSKLHENAYLLVYVNNINAHPWVDGTPRAADGTDPFYIVRTDQEALYKSGRRFKDDQVNSTKTYNALRFMQIAAINGDYGAVTTAAQIMPSSFSRWNTDAGIADQTGAKTNLNNNRARAFPLTAGIKLANEASVPVYLNMNWALANGEAAKVVRLAKAEITSTTSPIVLELGNEPWNHAYPYDSGCGYFIGYRQSIGRANIVGSDDPANGGYGYRAAQLMAEAHKEDGYTGRLRPVLNVQADNIASFIGAIAGVQTAISEWNDPNDAFYNPEFAARFKEPGQIFSHFAFAPYLYAGMDRGDMSSADQATLDSWFDATDDSGLTAFFDQLYNGNRLSSVSSSAAINTIPTAYAAQAAMAIKYQMPLVCYEAQVAPGGYPTAKSPGLWVRAVADQRMKQAIIDYGTKLLGIGVELITSFTEYGRAVKYPPENQSPYGSKPHLNDTTAPRYLGWKALQDTPPAPAPLSVSLTEIGSFFVGGNPRTFAKVQGGRGKKILTWSGLAPGRQYDGFRSVSGPLTTAGLVQGTLTVTDEFGTAPVTVTFDQNVLATVPVTSLATPAAPGYSISSDGYTATGSGEARYGFTRAVTLQGGGSTGKWWVEVESVAVGEPRLAIGLTTPEYAGGLGGGLHNLMLCFVDARGGGPGYYLGENYSGSADFSTTSGIVLAANHAAMLLDLAANTTTFFVGSKQSAAYPLPSQLQNGSILSLFMQLGSGDVARWCATSAKPAGAIEWG